MMQILVGLLPIIEQIGLWWINKYFTDQTQKAAALKAFEDLIALHKNDGNASASEHQSYQDQVDAANQKKS